MLPDWQSNYSVINKIYVRLNNAVDNQFFYCQSQTMLTVNTTFLTSRVLRMHMCIKHLRILNWSGVV